MRVEHEAKLKDKSDACLQCALLYTTASGHRRIRVHTISVPVTSVMSNIFRFADLDAIVNLSLKQAVRQLLDSTTCMEAQNALTMACIESLYVYRKFCASATSAGQLILPEPLKLLPLCTLGLVKHPLFQDGLAADERSFLFSFVNSMPCYVSVAFVCPRLFHLTSFDQLACIPDESGRVYLPTPLTLSSESVSSDGLYLLDDGRYMYLYIGSDLPAAFLEDVFAIKGDGKNQTGQYRIRHVPDQPQLVSSRINVLIGTLRKNKPNFQNLQIISRRPPANQPQTPHLGGASGGGGGGASIRPSPSPTNRAGWETFESLDESLFFSHLIEDSVHKQADGKGSKDKAALNAKAPNSMSYIDFLYDTHTTRAHAHAASKHHRARRARCPSYTRSHGCCSCCACVWLLSCFIHKRIQAKFCESDTPAAALARTALAEGRRTLMLVRTFMFAQCDLIYRSSLTLRVHQFVCCFPPPFACFFHFSFVCSDDAVASPLRFASPPPCASILPVYIQSDLQSLSFLFLSDHERAGRQINPKQNDPGRLRWER